MTLNKEIKTNSLIHELIQVPPGVHLFFPKQSKMIPIIHLLGEKKDQIKR